METRFLATCNYRQGSNRETAHAMKNGEHLAIYKAAQEMAKFIPTNAALFDMMAAIDGDMMPLLM